MMPALQRLLRPRAAPGWLAVEIKDRAISLAHVAPNGAQPVVHFAEERTWDPADPRSLERVAREFGVKRFQCTTLLRPNEYQMLLVEAPAVKRDELKAAVRWRIKDMLDYHVDDATVDVLDVPMPAAATQRVRQMYTVAARTATIRGMVERFAAGGIPLAVIDIPDTAQRNIATRLESDQRALVAVSLDVDGGLITVSFSGELYLSRRVDITSEQLSQAETESRARLFERIVIEVQRSLDHCERTYSFFALGRVAVSPFPDHEALREHLAANLYLPVEAFELSRIFKLPAGAAGWTPAEQAKWLKLLGAGLRVESKAL